METTAATVKQEIVDELLKNIKNPDQLFGPDGLLHQLKGALMERMLDAEMTEHLGFDKNDPSGQGAGNSRNGYSPKTVQTETGTVRIRVPRDRAGTFDPKVVGKHQRRLEGFDDKVLALYARGMSVREIQGHLRELYGTDVAPDLISRVTDAALDEAKAWQSRALDPVYAVIYLDALFVNIRDGGTVGKKAVYLALGVNLEGRREVLGIWVEGTEGARFWLNVLTDLKNRGVEDVFFVCCDGLTGFPGAIEAAFPKAVVQTCIVHMIRNSLRYVSYTDRKAVAAALRPVYAADNEQGAVAALDAFEERWGARYPTIAKQWRTRWAEVIPFLAFPKDIRKILYTTNAIESLNYQLRRVLKPKGHFPSDDAVVKLLFLAIERAQVHWRAIREWKRALAHFAIVFEDRFPA
jgi:putative transposase